MTTRLSQRETLRRMADKWQLLEFMTNSAIVLRKAAQDDIAVPPYVVVRLKEKGLVTYVRDMGTRHYSLTQAGRKAAEKIKD